MKFRDSRQAGPSQPDRSRTRRLVQRALFVPKLRQQLICRIRRRRTKCYELPRRIVFLRQWMHRVGVLHPEHFPTAHAAQNKVLLVNRDNSVSFVEYRVLAHDKELDAKRSQNASTGCPVLCYRKRLRLDEGNGPVRLIHQQTVGNGRIRRKCVLRQDQARTSLA